MKHFLFLCLVCTGLLAVMGCPTPDANDPIVPTNGFSGKLLYSGGNTNGMYEYTFQTQTKTKYLDGESHYFPQYLPNGDFACIQYINNSGECQILIMKNNGLSRQLLFKSSTGENKHFFAPRISPDGSKYCFSVYLSSAFPSNGSYVYTVGGGLVASFPDLYTPSWTPDGKIVFSGTFFHNASGFLEPTTTKDEGVYITNQSLNTVARVDPQLNKPYQAVVSPDGKKIACVVNSHIWVMNMDGSGLKQLTAGDKAETNPEWSPDGKYIACNCFGEWEHRSYEALAVVPVNSAAAAIMTNSAPYYPLEKGTAFFSDPGRLNAPLAYSWKNN